ncbi:MAG: ribonucleoside-diphosphate reductase, adenosylcobalamin-dependent [Fibrobacteres bacterium]|nr:ribonucleoside-diphosphate reductase, adenosylcobalamin-dependent [Fibrobacterota bacterium]
MPMEPENANNPSRNTQGPAVSPAGLEIPLYFSREDRHPFDTVEWERRDAVIEDEDGRIIFEQRGVEFPKTWSQSASQIVASKYFHGSGENREHSLKQLISRVAETIAAWGEKGGYFSSLSTLHFRHELMHLLLDQKMAFNSPVWFNVGIESKPQCSACFINGVEDNMDSILELVRTEGRLFKYGSGTGTNFSRLRSSRERLSGGGTASGPVSFMRGFDSFAGVIKSGGKTRRAAKMVILDADHPDILAFIRSKAVEEAKARALIDAGYSGGFNEAGGAYDSIQFQNANHSVRVKDGFMRAAQAGGDWTVHGRVDGSPMGTFKAADLLKEMAEAAWACGDPGLQFDTTINRWHTCPESGRINASNPCSEYMFLDDSACNLASLNLMRFRKQRPGSAEDGTFDVPAFQQAVDITLLAQEILVDQAGYPTPAIARNSHDYRPLGLGYANLGALLMARGLPYDSAEGRNFAAAITALMHGRANAMSARIAAARGPFAGFPPNRSAMLRVMEMHASAARSLEATGVPRDLSLAAGRSWEEAVSLGKAHGYRNAQVTVLAPTGTIAFMMDCDTTGVEPDIALVKFKRLVGGGMMKIVNRSVPEALRRLGYGEAEISEMIAYLERNGSLEGAPHIREAHLSVFDCAFTAQGGTRSIQPMGHLRMMAAVQPFLSGAISKTVNLPQEATAEAIREVFTEAWKLGLKSVAVYRDGSKRTQPLSVSPAAREAKPARRRLPDEREAITHKFSIAGHEGYVTVGKYEDGSPGELFVVMSKEGSVVSGLLDSFATAVSLALQYGVPLKVLIDKFSHSRYEPSGFTNNPQIRMAKSITDYIFRWLALKFMPTEEGLAAVGDGEDAILSAGNLAPGSLPAPVEMDAPPCPDCGSMMIRAGTCFRCGNCGGTSGCS